MRPQLLLHVLIWNMYIVNGLEGLIDRVIISVPGIYLTRLSR